MNDKVLLIKGITLLYKESLLKDLIEDNSKRLLSNLLTQITVPTVNIGSSSDFETIKELREILKDMVNDPIETEYDPSLIIQRINLIPYVDDKISKALEEGLKTDDNESNIKRSITILKKNIYSWMKEKDIETSLTNQLNKFRFKRDTIKDITTFIQETLDMLEPYKLDKINKDSAIINEVDIGDENSTVTVFEELRNVTNGNTILKTGWQALNRMLQGGFRRGEFVVISALPHMYKTGFSLSLFKQIAMYNTPMPSNKKPLLLRISFEDEMKDNLYFLYQNLIYNEKLDPNIKIPEVNPSEMSGYIRSELEKTGYSIKMMRVDPTQWGYENICKKIVEFESQGYEIHLLMLDYLSMVNTTGLNSTAGLGTDIRDLFRRIRNFCAPKKITVITPHQLSPEAKAVARTGIPRENFVKEIAEKGYYAGSRQLDQEMDIDMYIDLVKHNRETYLAVQRGKHRIPTIVEEKNKYFLLKFPPRFPIPDDLYREDSSYQKPGQKESNEDLFNS